MPWLTGGLQTNPAAAAVLADTGARSGPAGSTEASLELKLLATASAACGIEIQHRNAANNANVWQHAFRVAADTIVNVDIPVTVANGERVRVVMLTNPTGQVQASLRV
jgi:hypothetical protein